MKICKRRLRQFLGAVGKQVVKIKMTLYTKNLQDVAVEGKTR